MNKYVFNVTVEALLDSEGDMEPSTVPHTLDAKTIISPVIEFPNELRIGDKLGLAPEPNPMKDCVADLCHYPFVGHTAIDLEKRQVRGSVAFKVKEEFYLVVRNYMDVFDALHHQQPRG